MDTAIRITPRAMSTPHRRSLPTRPAWQHLASLYCGIDSTETVYSSAWELCANDQKQLSFPI